VSWSKFNIASSRGASVRPGAAYAKLTPHKTEVFGRLKAALGKTSPQDISTRSVSKRVGFGHWVLVSLPRSYVQQGDLSFKPFASDVFLLPVPKCSLRCLALDHLWLSGLPFSETKDSKIARGEIALSGSGHNKREQLRRSSLPKAVSLCRARLNTTQRLGKPLDLGRQASGAWRHSGAAVVQCVRQMSGGERSYNHPR
jgi:hypothetical protein